MDFLGSDETIRQAAAVHLAGRDVADDGFVFVTERLPAGIDRLGFRFTTGLPRTNAAAALIDRPAAPAVTDAQKQTLFQTMPEDVTIDVRAVEQFG